MHYQRLLSLCSHLDGHRTVPSKIDPIASVPLGEASDLCCRDSSGKGRISEASFQKIRAFRQKMAEWDRDYGGFGSEISERSRPK